MVSATGTPTLHQVTTLIGPSMLSYAFTVQFPRVGTYKIVKKLKLSQTALASAVADFTAALPGTCIDTLSVLQADLLAQYTFDCNNCETWCEQQADAQSLTGETRTTFIADCIADECTNTIGEDEMNCDVLLNYLKKDMSPGGQYYDASNWLSTNLGSGGPPYGSSFTFSAFNNYIVNDCGMTNPNYSTWSAVTAGWQDCYADFLVQFHPEYCHYTWCTDMAASNAYDIQLHGDGITSGNTLTWAQNNPNTTTEYIDVTQSPIGQNVHDHDPFFDTGEPGASYSTSMLAQLSSYESTGMSMWAYALTLTSCTTACDDQWIAFRALYLEKKHEYAKAAREAGGCYPLYDNTSPPDGVANATECNYTTINPPDCNPPGTNGFVIRWPDYTDNLEPINTSTEANNYADSIETAYSPCKTASSIDVTVTDDDFDFGATDCILISVNDGSGADPIMAASLCNMGEIDGATLVQLLVQAINAFVSVPDYTAAVNSSNPLLFTIYAPASLGSTPNTNYSISVTKPSWVTMSYSGSGKFEGGAETGDCPEPVHCLCARIDQLADLYAATYVDPVDAQTYYYVNHTTYTTSAAYILDVLQETDPTLTQSMVDNWITNCAASNGQFPQGEDPESETYEPLTEDIDCANPPVDCDEDAPELTSYWGALLYQQQVNQAINDFIVDYKAQCFGGDFEEVFNVTYTEREYHYTLYYYDQSGNLTRTVPPAAVDPLVLSADINSNTVLDGQDIINYRNGVSGAPFLVPDHARATNTLVTNYKYNTLNQVVESATPDGGTTVFFYDEIGRIVASQNAKQAAMSGGGVYYYSYIRYDAQGRAIETGQVYKATALTAATARDYSAFITWLTTSSTIEQVTNTYYDEALNVTVDGLFAGGQQFLRKRVATVTYERDFDNDPDTYDHATHFSYDVHGNVDHLVQDSPELNELAQQYKHITYEYDLVSGNVNAVHYQDGAADQFHHRYYYDADNRLTNVYTSANGMLWDQDAKYFYYLHGPMARTELGEVKVQGMDYAYTINGWIKGVNSNVLDETKDLGKDGTATSSTSYIASRSGLHSNMAKDAYGFVLGYYWNTSSTLKDWEPINSSAQSLYHNAPDLGTTANNLYNGNIRDMSVALMKPNASALPSALPVIFNSYRYDQLNRIDSAFSYTHLTNTTTYASHTDIGEYTNDFSYDANGNILTQLRNGIGGATTRSMDNLTYHYIAGTNKLEYVDDAGTAGNYADDLEDQSAGNYDYTQIGELKADVSEGIAEIEWTVNGKIHKITRTTGWSIPGSSPAQYPADLEFKYDAMGQRVCKIVKPRDVNGIRNEGLWTYTYYVRDASGNVMAVYERDKDRNLTQYNDEITLQETHLYGSARLAIRDYDGQVGMTSTVVYPFNGYDTGNDSVFITGTEVSHTHMAAPSASSQDRTLGRKVFELTNHLGNVLVTVLDRKLIGANTGGSVDFYLADVKTTSDYSAFGAPMPGRNFSSSSYRYGFNGMENDPESVGTGEGLQNFEARLYNPAIGRWLSTDPHQRSYPSVSAYAFCFNNPVNYIDLDGQDPTPSQLTWVMQHMLVNYPALAIYMGLTPSSYNQFWDYMRNEYGTKGEPVQTVDPGVMKSYYRNLKGIAGEVIFAESMITGTLPFFRATATPNPNQQTGPLRHDVFVELSPVRSAIRKAQRGTTLQLPDGTTLTPSVNQIGMEFYNVDGSTYKQPFSTTSNTKLYVEVKTIGPGAGPQLLKGYQQALRTAQALHGQANSYSVLAVDYDAYMSLYSDPKYSAQMEAFHTEFRAAGGHLLLIHGQTQRAEAFVDDAAFWTNDCYEDSFED